jgi:hypothetical protein
MEILDGDLTIAEPIKEMMIAKGSRQIVKNRLVCAKEDHHGVVGQFDVTAHAPASALRAASHSRDSISATRSDISQS